MFRLYIQTDGRSILRDTRHHWELPLAATSRDTRWKRLIAKLDLVVTRDGITRDWSIVHTPEQSWETDSVSEPPKSINRFVQERKSSKFPTLSGNARWSSKTPDI